MLLLHSRRSEKWVEVLADAYGLGNYQPTNNIIESLDYLELEINKREFYRPENLIAGYRGDDENKHSRSIHVGRHQQSLNFGTVNLELAEKLVFVI
ncbi:hypothetical protein NIES2101_16625 [Calothrix sp. HK-06]|nr:hypothetical protein NIES2101_16625 [Calothrix sp. HK-06]